MKLIRSKIPALVQAREGKALNTTVAESAHYPRLLESKMLEEFVEFLSDPRQPDELVDMLEVLYALGEVYGYTPEKLNALRQQKHDERGGFEERIVLHDAKS